MNFFFSLLGLILGTTCLLLVFILSIYRKTKIRLIWLLFNLAVAIWGFGAFLIGRATTPSSAITAWRLSHIGVIFISVFFFHTAITLCDIEAKRKKIIIFAYLQGLFFSVLNATPLFISKIRVVLDSIYYNQSTGLFYPIFFIIWVALVIWGHVELFLHYKKASGVKRNQILYFFLGTLVGFSGGTTNFFPMFNIDIFPFGNMTIPLYCIIVTYAILKYRLMDIRIAVTRAGIFLFVYAFVLGLPFWLGYKTKSWLGTGVAMLVLASTGPFIYSRLRQRAEEVLLKDQKRYQKALLTLSRNMHEVKELNKLLRLILAQVVRHLRLKEAAIYLLDKDDNAFKLKTGIPKNRSLFQGEISVNSAFVSRLKQKDSPLLAEELRSQEKKELVKESFASGMFVPCTTRDELVAFVALGPKPKGLIYNELDVNIFRILSLQAGLAIENCSFWEDEKTRLAREEQIRRYNTMDNFSASLAHEIDNPVTCVIGDLFCAMEFFKHHIDKIPEPLKQEAAAAFQKNKDAFDNMQRVTKLTKAVRGFSKENKGEMSVVSINEMLDEFLPLVEAQCKHSGIDFIKDIEPGINVEGNKVYLADALLNLATNAIHAISYGNETAGLDDEPQAGIHEKYIELKAYRKENVCVISLKDTGSGIPKKLKHDIFLDFVTTKASSVGTGMGLSRVRKIVDMHKGKVWYESEGQGKGATFFIELPVTEKSLPQNRKRRGKQ
jgi:signal transduction histidine kinase